MQPESNIFEAIVVGAGPAGIGAASVFKKEGLPYLVLEGRLKIGGRVQSLELDDVRVDLGACWIHSYGPKNPLSKYVKEFKIKQCVSNRGCGRKFFDGEQGIEIKEEVMESAYFHQSEFFRTAEQNLKRAKKDISLFEGAKEVYEQRLKTIPPAEKRCTQLLINMTEHYEASSVKQLSAENYEYREDHGGDFSPTGGYASLIRKISEGLNIKLNKKVVAVERSENIITVTCSNGEKYLCKKLISSLPLGVLKAGSVTFTPQLPEKHQNAINKIGVGLMNKIILSFSENFWGSLYWISIACDERGKYPHFYDFSQCGKHILCCFVTDDFARKIQSLTDNEIVEELTSLFKKIFKKGKVQIRDAVITRWGKDEFSLGSYASFHVGSTPEDCQNLRTAIDNQMWFVGEHCYSEHIGTAHGAMQTGEWAASEVLNALKWVNPIWKQPMKLTK